MQRANRQRIGLAIAIAVLLALALWQWRIQHQQHPAHLLTIAPERITRIEVSTRAAPPRRFIKHDGHWWMVAPERGRADDRHLARLAGIAAAKVLRWRPLGDFDRAKIGLTTPFAIVVLDGQVVRFGTLAALAPQRYVQVGDHVALIPARYAGDIAATADSELAPAASSAAAATPD